MADTRLEDMLKRVDFDEILNRVDERLNCRIDERLSELTRFLLFSFARWFVVSHGQCMLLARALPAPS